MDTPHNPTVGTKYYSWVHSDGTRVWVNQAVVIGIKDLLSKNVVDVTITNHNGENIIAECVTMSVDQLNSKMF